MIVGTMRQDLVMSAVGRPYGGKSAVERHEFRRRRLIEAARETIATHGVAAVTAEQVSQAAGLTKRYFYVSFASRETLLDTCAEMLFTELRAALDSALQAPTRHEQVHRAASAVVRLLAADPAWARLYMECSAFPRLRARQEQAIGEFTRRLNETAVVVHPPDPISVRQDLATRIVVVGGTDLIIAWLSGDIDADEQTLVATIAASVLGETTAR